MIFQTFNIQIAIPVFISWILIMGMALVLEKKQLLSQKISIIMLCIAFFIPGIIFAATPNPVFPIQMIIVGIKTGQPLSAIIPMVMILFLLLLTSIFFGRIFCGYACPLGGLQELLSKIFFKSTLKEMESSKTIKLNSKLTMIVRSIFFIIFIGSGLLWGASIIPYLNPFIGFQIFKNPVFPMVIIPFLEIIIIGIASVLIYRPWCRLFCPFGFLVSLTARIGVFKLHRNEKCTECQMCEKICPTNEAKRGDKKGECYLCNRCVQICPVDAIKFRKN
jgi:ferredoxin-type protein NapH